MGAWGSGSFENDDASAWIADFCADPDKDLILDAFWAITEMNTSQYLEAPDCSIGLAAAEIIAALKGAPHPDMPDEVKGCVLKLKVAADPGTVSLAFVCAVDD